MYIEKKSRGLDGEGRIGWVELSRSRRSYVYEGRRLLRVGDGYKYNCIDEETGEAYWVSGPHRDGRDKLYGGVVEIDADARVEYWTVIRRAPSLVTRREYRGGRATRTGGTDRRTPGATRAK
jgi:hypothetical protein